jgi:sulfur carrier protein ThiS adenylyltransferase
MNDFERALGAYFSAGQLAIIQKTKIGIAGAGGVGSNIAVCLARSGFKDFSIIDFDVVEMKNLNRQHYFLADISQPKVEAIAKKLKEINPDLSLKMEKTHLNDGNIMDYFQDRDVIFEAFDNVKSKKLLLEAFGNSGKLLVFGNGLAGISNQREIKIKEIKKNVFIVGDGVTCAGNENPPLAPRVIACAALMASVALERILKAA